MKLFLENETHGSLKFLINLVASEVFAVAKHPLDEGNVFGMGEAGSRGFPWAIRRANSPWEIWIRTDAIAVFDLDDAIFHRLSDELPRVGSRGGVFACVIRDEDIRILLQGHNSATVVLRGVSLSANWLRSEASSLP